MPVAAAVMIQLRRKAASNKRSKAKEQTWETTRLKARNKTKAFVSRRSG
jgi:hypothetical protein